MWVCKKAHHGVIAIFQQAEAPTRCGGRTRFLRYSLAGHLVLRERPIGRTAHLYTILAIIATPWAEKEGESPSLNVLFVFARTRWN
jgi:hypothetical protein